MTTNHLAQAMDHARGFMRNGCAVELEPQVGILHALIAIAELMPRPATPEEVTAYTDTVAASVADALARHTAPGVDELDAMRDQVAQLVRERDEWERERDRREAEDQAAHARLEAIRALALHYDGTPATGMPRAILSALDEPREQPEPEPRAGYCLQPGGGTAARFLCTRERGHNGPHVALAGRSVCDVWTTGTILDFRPAPGGWTQIGATKTDTEGSDQ